MQLSNQINQSTPFGNYCVSCILFDRNFVTLYIKYLMKSLDDMKNICYNLHIIKFNLIDMDNTSYIDRMKTEYTELQNRITKLKTYINSPTALEIQEEKLELLVRQYQVMNEYLSILRARISLESYTD